MSTGGSVVRTMRQQEVGIAVDWAAKEAWNQGIHDAEAFYATDPGGFFIAELDGEPVGSVSVVNYSEAFAFAGLYILKPEYQNQGYGSRLFAAGMAHTGERNVGGGGVLAMQEKYRTLACRNIRFEGTGGGNEPEGPVGLLAAYDARHFPALSPRFLAAGRSSGRAVILQGTAPSGDAATAIRTGRSLRMRPG